MRCCGKVCMHLLSIQCIRHYEKLDFFWLPSYKLSLQPKWLLFKMKMRKKYNGPEFLPSKFIATINTLIFWSSWGVCWHSCLFISWREQCEKKNISSPFDWLDWCRREARLAQWHISASRVDMVSSNPPNIRWTNLKKIALSFIGPVHFPFQNSTLTVSCDTALLVGR